MNRLKQPFQSSPVAFPHSASKYTDDHGGSIGVLEEGMEQPRTSPVGAFYPLTALPRGLDLGTPPFDPLSGKRR
jgi:hypothetical protein